MEPSGSELRDFHHAFHNPPTSRASAEESSHSRSPLPPVEIPPAKNLYCYHHHDDFHDDVFSYSERSAEYSRPPSLSPSEISRTESARPPVLRPARAGVGGQSYLLVRPHLVDDVLARGVEVRAEPRQSLGVRGRGRSRHPLGRHVSFSAVEALLVHDGAVGPLAVLARQQTHLGGDLLDVDLGLRLRGPQALELALRGLHLLLEGGHGVADRYRRGALAAVRADGRVVDGAVSQGRQQLLDRRLERG